MQHNYKESQTSKSVENPKKKKKDTLRVFQKDSFQRTNTNTDNRLKEIVEARTLSDNIFKVQTEDNC